MYDHASAPLCMYVCMCEKFSPLLDYLNVSGLQQKFISFFGVNCLRH